MKNILLKRSRVIVPVFVTLLFMTSLTAQAANYLVTPLAVTLDMEKRDLVTKTITIINKSSQMIRLYASVNEVSSDGEGVVEGFQSPSYVDRTSSPTSWIEVSRQRIQLKPGETREIPVTIRMNPKVKPGEYNVFIGFAEGSNRPTAEKKVREGQAQGTLLYISVDQKQNMFLRLEKYVISKFITEKKAGAISYTLANPGAVEVIPKGELIIYDTTGNEVSAISLNQENVAVSGGETQQYQIEVPLDLSMGKYKAFLSVEYGEFLTASINDTAFFYMLPVSKLIVIFIVILLLAILTALYVHRRYDDDVDSDTHDSVAMYIREGVSDVQHHDIDLTDKKKNETN